MKTILLIALVLVTNSAFAAVPARQSVAECKFKRLKKKSRMFCKASASICVPGLDASECRPELEVSCDGEKVFKGEWRPESKQDPERYVLKGIPAKGRVLAPEIEITPNPNDKRDNPAWALIGARMLTGSCELMLDFKTLSAEE